MNLARHGSCIAYSWMIQGKFEAHRTTDIRFESIWTRMRSTVYPHLTRHWLRNHQQPRKHPDLRVSARDFDVEGGAICAKNSQFGPSHWDHLQYWLTISVPDYGSCDYGSLSGCLVFDSCQLTIIWQLTLQLTKTNVQARLIIWPGQQASNEVGAMLSGQLRTYERSRHASASKCRLPRWLGKKTCMGFLSFYAWFFLVCLTDFYNNKASLLRPFATEASLIEWCNTPLASSFLWPFPPCPFLVILHVTINERLRLQSKPASKNLHFSRLA